jgi:hypothetical protein
VKKLVGVSDRPKSDSFVSNTPRIKQFLESAEAFTILFCQSKKECDISDRFIHTLSRPHFLATVARKMRALQKLFSAFFASPRAQSS